MNPTRVLVANRPRLTRELVIATISDQPDIEIVGEIQEEAELKNAVEETRPDFVIVALERSNRITDICESILRTHPEMRVIAIASDRNRSMYYWAALHIESNQIEASEAGLLGALRGNMQRADEVR
jgi:AmiR/NasT family two-component response regulator